VRWRREGGGARERILKSGLPALPLGEVKVKALDAEQGSV
jgi:hypothetical protein